MISVVRSWLDTVGVGQVPRVRVVAAAQLASQSLILLSMVRRGSLLGQSVVCCLVTALEALIISLGRQVRVVGLLGREYRMRGIWAIITCPKQSVTSHTCRCFGTTLVSTQGRSWILPGLVLARWLLPLVLTSGVWFELLVEERSH